MKVNSVTQTVKATIPNAQILDIFIHAVYGDAKKATGKDLTFYRALGLLVGIRDVEAVKRANRETASAYRITTEEFRRWLPTVFAEFARVMMEAIE